MVMFNMYKITVGGFRVHAIYIYKASLFDFGKTELWGAVCKKNYLEQICEIFSYLEIIKTARKFIYK